MKIALLSNINIDFLEDYLKADFQEIYKAGYDQYIHELLNSNSVLVKDDFDIVLLHLDGNELLKNYLYKLVRLEEIHDLLGEMLAGIRNAVEQFVCRKKKCLFIISALSIHPYHIHGLLDRNSDYSVTAIKEFLNNELGLFQKKLPNVLLLDWEKIVDIYGYERLYDNKYWYMGRMKYTSLALESLSKEIGYMVNGYTGKIKKVIALDLDNTLWGGVIGEDGLGGIVLSQEGIGKAYYDFQQLLKVIKKFGVSLAVCSKNNPDDITEVFNKHPMMVLKPDDFVSIKVNWNDKASNITEIASDLNVGLDVIVFIDDNMVERNIVKELLPEVAVPEFPKDPAEIPQWFIKEVFYPYFPKISVTEEDKIKTEQYLANAKRKEFHRQYSIIDFIRNLDIKLAMHVNDQRLVERTAQMTQKTNQFNLTTRRYTKSAIQNFMNSKDYYVFNMEYQDRFGSEGIVGTAIMKLSADNAYFDSFLVSCRVIGRNIEFDFLNHILDFLSRDFPRIKSVYADYIPTKKNGIAADFYEKSDFTIYQKTVDTATVRYKKNLAVKSNGLTSMRHGKTDNQF